MRSKPSGDDALALLQHPVTVHKVWQRPFDNEARSAEHGCQCGTGVEMGLDSLSKLLDHMTTLQMHVMMASMV